MTLAYESASGVAKRGIVLFAHGSRDPLWHRPIQLVAHEVAQNAPDVAVECAYLELSAPDLATACQRLLDQGSSTITIVPLFLGVGKHAREDLPLLVASLRAAHPVCVFELQGAVGEDPRLITLLAQIAVGQPKPPR